MTLIDALRGFGLGQIAVALLNLRLVSLLGWKPELQRMSLLLREVFYIHMWFIAITLGIFGGLTLAFAPQLVEGNALGAALAAAIGAFWLVRTVLQVTWYSASHWRGRPGRTVIHFTLLVVYGAMALTYFAAAWHNAGGL